MRLMAAVLLGIAVASCAGVRRSEDPVARDREVERDIGWKYLADDRFARIQFSCREGVVTLEGIVTTPSDREEAEDIARGITSVRKVKSNLQVRSR